MVEAVDTVEKMDDVLDKMESSVITLENKSPKSDYETLYKNWGKLGNQEERRKELLENQKNNRHTKVDKHRGILELVDAIEDNDIFHQGYKRRVYYRPSIYVAGFNKVSLSYNNVLMLSEWIVEKPEDLIENWYISPCPKGSRMLLIANRGKTKLFTKYGQFRYEMVTLLPGGGYVDPSSTKTSCCVLDCFYHQKNNTAYVIDFLAWNNQPMTDCDTEFRNYWLQSQFAERPEIGEINEQNNMRIVLLPKQPCTPEKLKEILTTWPPFPNGVPPLDGFLFYHKRAHYTAGETPLVGWLYSYMVPEVLKMDIKIHADYLAQKPPTYVDQATFIKEFEEFYALKMAKRNRYLNAKKNAMETEAIESETNEGVEAVKDENEVQQDETEYKEEAVEMEAEQVEENKKVEKTDDTEKAGMEVSSTVQEKEGNNDNDKAAVKDE